MEYKEDEKANTVMSLTIGGITQKKETKKLKKQMRQRYSR